MVFDIMLSSIGVSDGAVIHHTAIAVPKPIKPYNLKVPGATLEQVIQPCQLCILFQHFFFFMKTLEWFNF